MKRWLTVPLLWLLLCAAVQSYTVWGGRWPGSPATLSYRVNATTADMSAATALAEIREGIDLWAAQSSASIAPSYAGTSTDTTWTFNNHVNNVFFIPGSNGSLLGITKWAWDSNTKVIYDFDIGIYDGWKWYPGTTGCTGSGVYLRETVTHEFGHGIGMGHSSVYLANMYAVGDYCGTNRRNLNADDITGVRSLYPVIGPVPPPPCAPTIAPASATVAAAASTGNSVAVTATTGCAWTAVSNASWLTITSGASSSGNGSVVYSAAINTGAQRTGTLTVAGNTFTVTQSAAACAPSISPTSAAVAATASTGNTVAVTAAGGCAWTGVSNASWLTVTGGATGTGSGTVTYSAAANMGAQRVGTLTIGSNTFTVTQTATACTPTISPTTASIASGADDTGAVTVTAASGCTWTATSNATWISVTGGASGSGNGTVTYGVVANTGGSRTGTLTIAGNTFTLTQAAPPPTASFLLSVRAYKAQGWQFVDLTWSGSVATSVDLWRDGVKFITTPNDGQFTNALQQRGSGSYQYKVCEAGTTVCTPEVTATF
jgi:hypothetical protein